MSNDIEIQKNLLETLDKILERMAAKANEMGLPGVCVAGVFDDENSLLSRSKDCGKLFKNNWNYLAIAFSKVSEMCATLQDSGDPSRSEIHGEFAYPGGAVKQVGAVHYVVAFSGAKGEEDLLISRYGMEIL